MNATHNTPRLSWRFKAILAAVLMVASVGVSTQTANAWQIGAPGIYNMGQVGIGVVHTSRTGPYNAILPVGRSTSGLYGWAYATGFYVGPGWCTNYYIAGWDSYVYRWTVRGPAYGWKVPLDDAAVYSYPC